MTKDYLISLIELATSHIEFGYKGVNGLVMAFGAEGNNELFYGDNEPIKCFGTHAVMNTPFIDGKSINDLFDKLEFW